MTVSTSINRVDYTGDGVEDTFAYTFKIFAGGDLDVYVDGVLQTLNVDYTVTGAGNPSGGNVVFEAGSIPANGATIAIIRVLDLTQETDYVEGDKFAAETHENALDKLTMICQQIKETFGRALKFLSYSTFKDVDLPDLEAGKYLAVNSGGTGVEWVVGDPLASHGSNHSAGGGDDIQVSATNKLLGRASAGAGDMEEITCTAAGRALLDDADAAAQRDTLGLPSRIGKNALINGAFDIWQRGTSFAAVANGSYFADRFAYIKDTISCVHTFSRDTDVPTAAQFLGLLSYSLKAACTTIDSSIGAADVVWIDQRIEGYNFKRFVGQYGTLSFWVKAYKTGTYCVAFVNDGQDRAYVAEYTINSSNTWEKKTITVNFNYSGGTWNYTNGLGLCVRFVLAAGSNYQTAAGSWQNGNYVATSNQVNGVDSTNNNFWLAGIQFELGQVATPFEFRPVQDELSLCERYYEKSFTYDVAPGTDNVTVANTGCLARANSTSDLISHIYYRQRKRDNPAVTIYAPLTTSPAGKVRRASNGDIVSITVSFAEECGVLLLDGGGNLISGESYQFGFAADAEL